MTKPALISSIIEQTKVDASKQIDKDKTVFDYLNDQTVKYLHKLATVINAIPA